MAEQKGLTVGILSIGDMGRGIGHMLVDHKYRVVTYAGDRSEATQERARSSGIELLSSVADVVKQCDCILSIVPPRDASTTAERVFKATPSEPGSRGHPLYFLDLNAISPGIASKTEKLFQENQNIVLIDGGIIGGVPYPKPESASGWNSPSLIVSGPTQLPFPDLSKILSIRHLDRPIGAAAGLKMCFASTTKGFFALAIQSYVTAEALGVLPELREYMQKYNPATMEIADKGVVAMPPKAYRWVHEMKEVGMTMEEDGGFSKDLFDGIAEVYRVVAEDTDLGLEQPGRRSRGKTVDDVVATMRSGIKATKES